MILLMVGVDRNRACPFLSLQNNKYKTKQNPKPRTYRNHGTWLNDIIPLIRGAHSHSRQFTRNCFRVHQVLLIRNFGKERTHLRISPQRPPNQVPFVLVAFAWRAWYHGTPHTDKGTGTETFKTAAMDEVGRAARQNKSPSKYVFTPLQSRSRGAAVTFDKLQAIIRI